VGFPSQIINISLLRKPKLYTGGLKLVQHEKVEGLDGRRRTHYSTQIGPDLDGKEVTVFGWAERIRDLGGIKFIILRDSHGRVQITVPETNEIVSKKAKSIGKEDVIGVKGVVKEMDRAPGGAEIIPNQIKLLNTAISPLPLELTGKVEAELDTRLNARILDLRRPRPYAFFRLRHGVSRYTREFLIDQGFLEIHTPKIISSATEGGTELFPIAYFEDEAFLAQSPQLYKEVLTAVFEKVFEIAPVFRAEESSTTRHLAELIMIDIEQAFATADDIMKISEELIAYVMRETIENYKNELKTLKSKITPPSTPFPRYTYDEILEILNKKGIKISWGEDLHTQAIRTLGEIFPGPYFITDWPIAEKPFYIAPKEDNPKLAEGFDLMYGWLELASGGTRVHNKSLLIQRLEEKGLNPLSFEFHLKAFDWGMPPHAGCGIGLARTLMVLTGAQNIREVVLFPRDRHRLTP